MLSQKHQLRKKHLLAFAILIVTGLAVAALTDYGNVVGDDEWAVYYFITKGSWIYFTGRLFDLVLFRLFYPIYNQPYLLHYFCYTMRVVAAFLLYFTIVELDDRRSLFGLAAALLYMAFQVKDWFTLQEQWTTSSSIFITTLCLSVYLFARYARTDKFGFFIAALMVSVFQNFIYEGAFALSVFVPFLILLYWRKLKARLPQLGLLWLALVGTILTQIFLIPRLMGLDQAYSMGVFDFSVVSMFYRLMVQLKADYYNLLFTFVTDIRAAYLGFGLMAGVGLLALFIFQTSQDSTEESSFIENLLWLVSGGIISILGLGVYLVTSLAETTPVRGHIISAPGTAILLSALVWLITGFISLPQFRSVIRFTGIALLMGLYAVLRINVQQDMIVYETHHEAEAYFFRSLAHLAPDVENNTLLILIEDPTLYETPFTGGFAFQFAIRYLYDDAVFGWIPTDTLLNQDVTVSDAGVNIYKDPPQTILVGPIDSFYGWDEVIFLTKLPSGQAEILESIPEPFYTEERAALYDPHKRIHQDSFIPARIQELYPPEQTAFSNSGTSSENN